jgi:hypothetical protein
MTIVDDQIWLLHEIMTYPESSDSVLVHLLHVDWRGEISMAKHAKAEERVSHCFGEEDTPNLRRHVGEGISYTANDDVLEDGGTLDKW